MGAAAASANTSGFIQNQSTPSSTPHHRPEKTNTPYQRQQTVSLRRVKVEEESRREPSSSSYHHAVEKTPNSMNPYQPRGTRGENELIQFNTHTTQETTTIPIENKRQSGGGSALPRLMKPTPTVLPHQEAKVASPTQCGSVSSSTSSNRSSGVFSAYGSTNGTASSNPESSNPVSPAAPTRPISSHRSRPPSPGRHSSLPALSTQTSVPSAIPLVTPTVATTNVQNHSRHTSATSSASTPASIMVAHTQAVPTAHRRLASTGGPVTAFKTPSENTASINVIVPAGSASATAMRKLQPSEGRGLIRVPAQGAVSPPNEKDDAGVPQQQRIVQPAPVSVAAQPSTVPPAHPQPSQQPSQKSSASTSATNTAVQNSPQSTSQSQNSQTQSDHRVSGMVSPTTFMNINQLYSEENPEFVEYKKKWELMRDLQTNLRSAGGLKGGRSLLSPVNSQGNTRTHSRAASVATSPRALSPYGHEGGGYMHVPMHGQHASMTVFPTSPSSGAMRSPSGADGVTTFDFPIALPVDELGEELATPCSPVPGPFVHAGSLFAILVESNRNSPMPSSPIPGYKMFTPEFRGGNGTPSNHSPLSPPPFSGGHHRSRTQANMPISSPSSPGESRPDSRSVSHGRRSSVPMVHSAIQEEVSTALPTVTRESSATIGGVPSATTDWRHVERRLNGLVVSQSPGTPSPPPLVSPTHAQVQQQQPHSAFVAPAASFASAVHGSTSASLSTPTSSSSSSSSNHVRGPSPLPAARARITILPASALPPTQTQGQGQVQPAVQTSQAPLARSDSQTGLRPSRRNTASSAITPVLPVATAQGVALMAGGAANIMPPTHKHAASESSFPRVR